VSIENLWNPASATAMSSQELLLYRSNLLGADRRVTNFGAPQH
jgi:rhamnose utilization protein RhaD (predicted bifunctional aldolase and dehydrogenase)